MSNSLPKSKPKPYRSVKGKVRQSGRPYTLRLLDERARGGSRPAGYPDFMEVVKVKQPTASLGWCLPNNFEVSIDGLLAEFRVELLKKGKQGQWVITSLQIKSQRQGGEVSEVNLPLQTLLNDAINLSTLRCITYPPNYEGESVSFSEDGWDPGSYVFKVDGAGYTEIVGWADSTPAPLLRDFTDSRSGRKADSMERFKVVAKAHNSAKHGEKHQKVKAALELLEGAVGDDTVKRLIKKANSLGLIKSETRSKK